VPQRIDAGPALAALGAALLAVSLFLDWFELGGATVTGWGAFEALDLLLFGIAVAALALAASRMGGTGAGGDPRLLPLLGTIAAFAIAVQILDPPPGVGGGEVAEGGWLGLGGALLLLLGGLLAAASISVVVTVAGRETRPRVPAVDRRRGRGADAAPASAPAERASRPDGDEDATLDRAAERLGRPAAPAGSSSLFADLGPDDERTQAYDVDELTGEPRAREPRAGGPSGGEPPAGDPRAGERGPRGGAAT